MPLWMCEWVVLLFSHLSHFIFLLASYLYYYYFYNLHLNYHTSLLHLPFSLPERKKERSIFRINRVCIKNPLSLCVCMFFFFLHFWIYIRFSCMSFFFLKFQSLWSWSWFVLTFDFVDLERSWAWVAIKIEALLSDFVCFFLFLFFKK